MKILALSGSMRAASSNTALLCAIADVASVGVEVRLFDRLDRLPIFSPDREGDKTPTSVREFCTAIAECDGILIASPEYIHAIPGGLKNAIDWLVSGQAIIGKPIALAHASHRGEDMLAALRLVLATVSSGFTEDIFLRIPLMSKTPAEMDVILGMPEHMAMMCRFLSEFESFARETAVENRLFYHNQPSRRECLQRKAGMLPVSQCRNVTKDANGSIARFSNS